MGRISSIHRRKFITLHVAHLKGRHSAGNIDVHWKTIPIYLLEKYTLGMRFGVCGEL
jgi:hypothetical protein